MGRKLRVGIIGCGKIANADHVPGYLRTPGAEIVALLDIVPAKMEALNAKHGLSAQPYTDLATFLNSGLNAVSICTPNSLHCPQTLAALKAGLHVLCEKPMAAVTAEATRMVDAAARAGKVLQINQTLHYLPVYAKMAETVQAGVIGEVIHVRCLRCGGNTPDVGWSPGAKWFVSKAFQGGVVLDIGVHMAELMQWVAGDIAEIAAYVDTRKPGIDVPDNASVLMRYASGATGMLTLSWTMPVGGGFFEVYGTKGTLRQGFASGPESFEVILKNGKAGKRKTVHPKPKPHMKNSQQRFIEAIDGKSPSPTPGELGREAIALCQAIQQSGETGRMVKVKRF